ncbi:MAG: hydrogenase maturation nickel metallochaperone HypA [Trueperaceae bacterium]|nr:MAG: hydrogenase maturation nickel metallochaperone HypA [Trueperaceae bacterium]
MHELSIAKNIIEIAEQHARQEGAAAITKVALQIGTLSGVVPEALEFAFEAARVGTMAASAELEMEIVPLICSCGDCKLEFTVEDRHGIALCPKCGKPSSDIRRGRELAVHSLEVV